MNNKNYRIGILGCGWLGAALAAQLTKQGHQIIASARSQERLASLHEAGIQAFKLQLPCSTEELAKHPILQQDKLVIAITPGFRRGDNAYAEHIASIVTAAEQTQCQQIILLSSSAVYQGCTGAVNELTPLALTTEKTQVLARAEQSVLAFSTAERQGCVLRLGGLIGPQRHPGKFLAGKTAVPSPQAPINLLHQRDAVAIISALLMQHGQDIYNGVSPCHVSRQQFYRYAATCIGAVPPTFTDATPDDDSRIIAADKLQQLGYRFSHPDLMSWLDTKPS